MPRAPLKSTAKAPDRLLFAPRNSHHISSILSASFAQSLPPHPRREFSLPLALGISSKPRAAPALFLFSSRLLAAKAFARKTQKALPPPSPVLTTPRRKWRALGTWICNTITINVGGNNVGASSCGEVKSSCGS